VDLAGIKGKGTKQVQAQIHMGFFGYGLGGDHRSWGILSASLGEYTAGGAVSIGRPLWGRPGGRDMPQRYRL